MVSGRVSRLYNTLEKIRTGEQGSFSAKKSAPARGFDQQAGTGRKQRIVLLGASALLALTLVVFFAGPKRKTAKTPVIADAVTADTVAPAPVPEHPAGSAPRTEASPKTSPAASPAPALAGTGDAGRYQQLNNKGLALIQENQHWRGIYYLEQAHKQQPERPEPLINLAVALAELGLHAPAKRFFSEAHALAPNHPMLRKNLEILGQANFFDPQWLSSLTAGQVQPGQTAQPK